MVVIEADFETKADSDLEEPRIQRAECRLQARVHARRKDPGDDPQSARGGDQRTAADEDLEGRNDRSGGMGRRAWAERVGVFWRLAPGLAAFAEASASAKACTFAEASAHKSADRPADKSAHRPADESADELGDGPARERAGGNLGFP